MFISWAYNIYMVSTTPILDFKQRYKEHARFKTLAPRMYTNARYTIWTRTQKVQIWNTQSTWGMA